MTLVGHQPTPHLSIMEPVVQRNLPLCEVRAAALSIEHDVALGNPAAAATVSGENPCAKE